MATTKKHPAPKGSFALIFDSASGECPRCAGLSTLRVEDAKGLIGYVVAEWPWHAAISDNPTEHPPEPHYEVEWFAQDPEGKDILGIRAADPYFIARAIHDAHRIRQSAA